VPGVSALASATAVLGRFSLKSKGVFLGEILAISAKQQAVEHSRTFRRAYRWRAGIEGRINSLRRDYGLRRGAYLGMARLKRWLGRGIVASNLKHIAQAKAARSRQ
jgi:Transposase DDE domain